MFTFLGILGVGLIAGLAWTGNLTKVSYLTKGFVSIFVDNKIKSVEGAQAVYNTAIEDAKSELAEMGKALVQISGQRQLLEQDIKKINDSLPQLTKKCEQFISAGRRDEALPFAMEYERLHIEMKGKADALPVLQANEAEAKKYLNLLEQRVMDLKQERDTIIQEIRLNKTVAEVNQNMANIRNKMPSKMLETVREGAREAKQNALGSETVRKSLMTTKIEVASDTVNRMNASAFLDSLERKALPSGNKK